MFCSPKSIRLAIIIRCAMIGSLRIKIHNSMITLHKTQTLSKAISIFSGITLLFACAQISIPLTPVPISMQTFAVFMIALFYKPSEAMQIISYYLILGFSGAPVFAGYKGGIQMLYGPTAGYLFGFLVAIYYLTRANLSSNKNASLDNIIKLSIATLIIYSLGISWLSFILGITLKTALLLGCAPFIIPGAIKSFLLALAIQYFGVTNNSLDKE
jgi:biotin transport system substrate-specific component